MAEGARIYSVDALSMFRAAMIKFAEGSNVALTAADGDVDRVLGWLERDQTVYWQSEVRKRHAYRIACEDAVRQKRLYKNVDGTAKSVVDEQKELQKAKQKEDEALQKQVMVKRAIVALRKESMLYKGRVQRLATALQSDIPAAVRNLDGMLDHIANYLSVQTVGTGIGLGDGGSEMSVAAPTEKLGLERLRGHTPTTEQRQAAAFTQIGPEHPIREAWKIGTMQDWQTKALDGLAIDRQLPDPDSRVILHPDIWQKTGVYLERLEAASDRDSGWYIGPVAENPPAGSPEYLAIRLGDCIAVRPDFAGLLSLPIASLVVLDAGGPTAIFDQLGLDIWSLALIKSAEPIEQPAAAEATTTEAPISA